MRWRWRARAWPVSVGPAGFLAPGLLLGPTLYTFIPLMRTDCVSTMVGVRSTVLVLSVSVPRKQTKTIMKIDQESNNSLACVYKICAATAAVV